MLRETPLYLRLNAADDVVIACRDLEPGTNLLQENVVVAERIPSGHKVATCAIAAGAPVHRYSQIIGFATRPIAPGQHVHVHNLEVRGFERDYAFGEAYRPTEPAPEPARRAPPRARRRAPPRPAPAPPRPPAPPPPPPPPPRPRGPARAPAARRAAPASARTGGGTARAAGQGGCKPDGCGKTETTQ